MTSFSYGQKSAKIIFKDVTKMKATPSMPEIVKNMIQAGKLDKSYLFEFKQLGYQSIFKNIEEEKDDESLEDNGVMVINTNTVEDSYYWKDTKANQLTMLKSLDGKNYKMVDKLPKITWELENKPSKVMGYDVLSAVTRDSFLFGNPLVRVWFAPELPISNGPFLLGGLPGMILKVEMVGETSNRIIEATSIELNKSEITAIEIPKTKFKKELTLKEFEDKKEEMVKRMTKMGSRVIKH